MQGVRTHLDLDDPRQEKCPEGDQQGADQEQEQRRRDGLVGDLGWALRELESGAALVTFLNDFIHFY